MRFVLAQLTGPGSLLVWLFVLVSGLWGWICLVVKAAEAGQGIGDVLRRSASSLPAWLAIVTLHVCLAWITFVIAVQWGEFESTDSMESLGKFGGSFEVARSTISFWVVLVSTGLLMLSAWAEDWFPVTLCLGAGVVVASVIVMLMNPAPITIGLHLVYLVLIAVIAAVLWS